MTATTGESANDEIATSGPLPELIGSDAALDACGRMIHICIVRKETAIINHPTELRLCRGGLTSFAHHRISNVVDRGHGSSSEFTPRAARD